MANCSKCGKEHGRNGRYCLDCHNAYMREWRKTHFLNPLQKIKDTCRHIANVYQARGKLIKQPCEVCGDPNSEKHHDDYAQPLTVRWFCNLHHRLFHKQKLCA